MTDPEVLSTLQERVCAVTGGAGFIGSHVCDALAGAGALVRVIDDLSNGRRENLAHLPGVRLVEGSVLDRAAVADLLDGADTVFHLAAITSVPRSVEMPQPTHDVNATGTFNVLDEARRAGVRRVIFSSSSSVYGDQAQSPKVETMRPDPLSPYAAAKCAAEHYVRAFAHCYGLSCVSLRYFNIFGPRQRSDSPYAAVIPLFAEALRRGSRPRLYGDGSQTRDFTHVDNAVHANLLAAACAHSLAGEAINIACGHRTSVGRLTELIARYLGVEPAVEHAPPRTGEVLHSTADIGAAKALIGYEPIVDFEVGLERTLRE
jgi:UDP-glucose 4-epimerase